MTGRLNTLVTGADRGLGAALAAAAAARGDRVWAACLGPAPESELRGVDVIGQIDVADDVATVRLRGAARRGA